MAMARLANHVAKDLCYGRLEPGWIFTVFAMEECAIQSEHVAVNKSMRIMALRVRSCSRTRVLFQQEINNRPQTYSVILFNESICLLASSTRYWSSAEPCCFFDTYYDCEFIVARLEWRSSLLMTLIGVRPFQSLLGPLQSHLQQQGK